jgi:hypothetical protein
VATVYKAVCTATNNKVIIKAYFKQKMHPKHHHKLAREIDAMKMLDGPYIAQLYAHFEDTQCIYLIMEFCEGGDLFKTMLMHGGLLDEQWVCVEVRRGRVMNTCRRTFWEPFAAALHACLPCCNPGVQRQAMLCLVLSLGRSTFRTSTWCSYSITAARRRLLMHGM